MQILALFSSAIWAHPIFFESPRQNRAEFPLSPRPTLTIFRFWSGSDIGRRRGLVGITNSDENSMWNMICIFLNQIKLNAEVH